LPDTHQDNNPGCLSPALSLVLVIRTERLWAGLGEMHAIKIKRLKNIYVF
jgi:hypothetical protein